MYYKIGKEKITKKDSKKEAERLYKEYLISEKIKNAKILRKRRNKKKGIILCLLFRKKFGKLLVNRFHMRCQTKH